MGEMRKTKETEAVGMNRINFYFDLCVCLCMCVCVCVCARVCVLVQSFSSRATPGQFPHTNTGISTLLS